MTEESPEPLIYAVEFIDSSEFLPAYSNITSAFGILIPESV